MRRTKKRQLGAAILTAMLLVTLVASIASAAAWRTWRNTEIEGAERVRVQSHWVLTAALNWARLIIREDTRSGGPDHLGEPWAIALQESRLSTFLAAEGNVATNVDVDEANEVFLSGEMTDMQGRINLSNLQTDSRTSAVTANSLSRLFAYLELPNADLQKLLENWRFSRDFSPENLNARASALPIQHVADLTRLGLDKESVDKLEPFLAILPTPANASTPINLNTASAEVIYALQNELSFDDAKRLVRAREAAHFRTVDDAARAIGRLNLPGAGATGSAAPAGGSNPFADGRFTVATNFFLVTGRLRSGNVVVQQRSLVHRQSLANIRVLWREASALALSNSASNVAATTNP
jgi:general secretion pathway protein K